MKDRYKENPLHGRKDLQQLASDMLCALKPYYSKGCALLHLGETATHHSVQIADMEAFARPLFGMLPLSMGGYDSGEMWDIYVQGIIHGTDPDHEEYWGEVTGGQMVVEMTTLGLGLLMAPEKIWEPLSDRERSALSEWLYQINRCEVGRNNWAFFTVIVNLGLQHVGEKFSLERMKEAFCNIDNCYIGDGWYTDGPDVPAMDYYIPFAMHFYGLVCARFLDKLDKERSNVFKERAGIFAADFIFWFTEDGSAVPFGRSLTYRFAMSAFWGALAFAEVEVFAWGVMKGILLRNLRWWMQQPFYSDNGIMTIGYAYPNLKVSEYYIAPGSSYWAMKAFLPLALPEQHPFWQAKEEALPAKLQVRYMKKPMMLVCSEQDRNHTFILTSGQFPGFVPDFIPSKYEKFAYSAQFGFSVPAGEYDLDQGAFDSTLAFCEHDRMYRTRLKCERVSIKPEYIYSFWKPYANVEVETYLIPCLPWHVRLHRIKSGRKLETAEGGFSIFSQYEDSKIRQTAEYGSASIETPFGRTEIVDLYGGRRGECIDVRPNTNVLYPKTLLPMLTGDIEIGEILLACAVLGQPAGKDYDKNVPSLMIKDNNVSINNEIKIKFIP